MAKLWQYLEKNKIYLNYILNMNKFK